MSINNFQNRSCPLCGKHEKLNILDLHYSLFDDNPLSGNFSLVACRDCGFAYADTPSKEPDFEAYYAQNAYYFTAATTGSGGNSPSDKKRFSETADCIASHIESKTAAIFDIGSGKGGLVATLKEMGFSKVFAIDPLQACVDYIEKSLGIPAECGKASSMGFKNISVDCCIYSHVLEHVLNPKLVLEEAWRRLNDRGLIYVEVPDAAQYGKNTNVPYAELFVEHINHFDMQHVISLMNTCGFIERETGGKMIDIGEGGQTACLYGVFEKTEKSRALPKYQGELYDTLRRYAAACEASPMHAAIRKTQKNAQPLYIWGMSQFGQLLLGQTPLGACNIKAFVDGDSHKQTKTIGKRAIVSLEILRNATSNDAIILTGVNYQKQMRDFLKQIDFKGLEIVLV